MISVHVEASRQIDRSRFRPAVKCICCKRPLSLAEQVEKFCTHCSGQKSISSNQGEQS